MRFFYWVIISTLGWSLFYLGDEFQSVREDALSLRAQLDHQEKTIDGLTSVIAKNMANLDRLVKNMEKPLQPLSGDEKLAMSPVNLDKYVDFLTDQQVSSLMRAYEIGSERDLGLAMMGICMQETLCGETTLVGHMTVDVGDRSYGVMQVKVAAAIDAMLREPELNEWGKDPAKVPAELIIAKLLTDNDWNMKVCRSYLEWLKERGLSWREMLTAYNLGVQGSKRIDNPLTYKYTEKVISHIDDKKFRDLVRDYENKG